MRLHCLLYVCIFPNFTLRQAFYGFVQMVIMTTGIINEPSHEKIKYLHMRNQRRRSVTAKLIISAFVCATWIVQFLYFLNPKFAASSMFLWLNNLVCVGPGTKPHCWFSHKAAHLVSVETIKVNCSAMQNQFTDNTILGSPWGSIQCTVVILQVIRTFMVT